jgi:ATP-dependent exoDNAse (exonuclease V) beta subunit
MWMAEVADAAARRRAIHTTGSVLVQAPAGSGKTTLLAQRYLRLLGAVDAPERILALTFTRRAALEMRERVLQALEAASRPACPEGMNVETWGLGVVARRRMAALGQELERHPSRLRIETIDAFNAWVAAQLPITAGAGGRLNLVSKPQPLYEEAARRALAYEELDPFGRAVDRVLELDDQRWLSLVNLIAGMLPTRDRWLPLLAGRLQITGALDAAQLHRVRRHLDEDLDLLVSRTLRLAAAAIGDERLHSLSVLLHGAAQRVATPQSALEAWRAAQPVLRPHTVELERWRGVAAILLTKAGTFRRQLTKNEGFPPQCADKSALLELIAELDREPAALHALLEIRTLPAPCYGEAQWARVREVAQVLVLACAELAEVFREQGSVDFPAVALASLRALGSTAAPTDLALRLDYRLQHILIDEFQDTSSGQLELLRLLTAGWQRGDGRSVFCVGDPMQSIYGFRQAEVRAFLELAEQGIGDVQFELERLRSNFRSAKPLVDWINGCFAAVLPRADDRDRGAIAFRASESALGTTVADSGVSLRGFASRRDEADAIAATIAARTASHPEWRIAILVRAKTHARDLAFSLRARGVAFRALDIEPLEDRPVVRDLVMLTAALLHLGDRTAWLAVLRAPWTGLLLGDLLTLARAAPVIWDGLGSDAVQGLTPDGQARCARLRDVLQIAFRVRGQVPLSRWVEQTWLALGGPACAPLPQDLDHARTVFARLRELEQQGLPDPADFARNFADLFAESRTAAAVEIMTIHKAKGLEFDLVVVPALDRATPNHADDLLLAHPFARADRDGMVLAARPGVGGEPDPLFDFLRHQSRAAQALEAQRLLYVACTRAKWQLSLTAVLGVATDDDEAAVDAAPRREWQPRAGSLLAVLWPVIGHDFSAEPALAAVNGTQSAPRGGPLQRVPDGWLPRPPGEGDRLEEVAVSSAVRAPTPVFDWAGETARRVGSLVHAELQMLDLEHSDPAAIRARAAHYRRWLAAHGVPAERLEDAAARVTAALCAVHGDERGRWLLGKGYRDDFREHALSGRWRGGIVRVVFDRSFIDHGVRWVIDYKTSHHGGGNLQEFLQHEVERYTPQLDRYAALARQLGPEPVRVGLYFPLLRAWREWQP